MSTIGELVGNNPMYEKGVFLDSSYYKQVIPESRFQELAPSKEAFRTARIQQIALRVFKEITLVSCVLVPSISVLGSSLALVGVISAALIGVMTYDLDSTTDPVNEGWIKKTEFKSQLLAMLSPSEKRAYFLRELKWDLAVKVSFLAGVLCLYSPIASTLATFGAFIGTFHYVHEAENMILLSIRHHVERKMRASATSPSPA